MEDTGRNNVQGALYALAAMGVYATHDVIIKTLGAHYTAFQIVFFAALLSFPLVTLILVRDRSGGNLRPVHPWWTALRTACAVITGTSAFYAFSVLPLAQTYALLFATPLLVTVFSVPILGEKVHARRWAAVVVGLIGVLIVLRPGGDTQLGLGHAAGMVSALTASLAAVTVRKIARDERPVVLMLFPLLGNFLAMA
ncbi:DMT family transporter [Frigidibacter sp. MR17.14]|uniref:DMT family transporter n=1 Tax=Frigidibacter sp. MR17.14 TaxID=3126509 RepID=UPI003012B2BD